LPVKSQLYLVYFSARDHKPSRGRAPHGLADAVCGHEQAFAAKVHAEMRIEFSGWKADGQGDGTRGLSLQKKEPLAHAGGFFMYMGPAKSY
jgi:hypothetical protein